MAAIYQRGKKGIWWIKYYVAGKPVYYSLRTTNARAAERIKKQIEGDEAKGELLAPSRTPLPELLEDYCQFMGTFRTPKPCSADVSILRIVFGPITPALELGSHVNRRFRTDTPRRARDTLVPRHILAKHLEDVTGRVLEDFITTRIREDGISATRSSSWTASSSPNGTRRKGHRVTGTMAGQVETKAHNDRPFFALALRTAVVGAGERGGPLLRSIATFANLFQHGGRPLNHLTEVDYAALVPRDHLRQMFLLGVTYRPGFIVNSWELTGPVHVPRTQFTEHRQLAFETLETLPIRGAALAAGTRIGTCNYAGRAMPVHIPARMRGRHTHLIGRSDMGKSSLMERMILDDIGQAAQAVQAVTVQPID